MSGLMSDQQKKKKRLREDFLYCFVVVVVSSGLRTLESPSSSRLSNTIRDDALLDVTAWRTKGLLRSAAEANLG